LSLEVAIYILKKKLYMFWMKSNGESDENILYLLTTYIAEAFFIGFHEWWCISQYSRR
jgi:hypothetical protein